MPDSLSPPLAIVDAHASLATLNPRNSMALMCRAQSNGSFPSNQLHSKNAFLVATFFLILSRYGEEKKGKWLKNSNEKLFPSKVFPNQTCLIRVEMFLGFWGLRTLASCKVVEWWRVFFKHLLLETIWRDQFNKFGSHFVHWHFNSGGDKLKVCLLMK